VAARALARFPGVAVPTDPDEKVDDLDPRVLAEDPQRWYAALEEALAEAELGPPDDPTATSPASRLVDTCRNLES
jgi:hypothetical protein